jgi:4-amino-4-deoxy-L-arabinose transferase-like glycosyltransferase
MEKHAGKFVIFVLAIALILRILALFSLDNSVYADFLMPDELTYHLWAKKSVTGQYIPFPVSEMSLLPAYLMIILYKIFSPDPLYFRILNIILGILTCGFIYLIGKNLAGKTAGLIACIFAAIYEPFIFYNITILKETLTLFLFAATVYLLLVAMDKVSIARLIILGLTFALWYNVRQNGIILLPVIPFLFLWEYYCRGLSRKNLMIYLAVFIIGFAFAVLPLSYLQYRARGEFGLTPAAGFNLYLANNPENPYPYYQPVKFSSPNPSEQAIHFTVEASRRIGQKLTIGEASSYWIKEVANNAFEHPVAFVKKLALKTLSIFNRSETDDNYDVNYIYNFVTFFQLPFLSFWFIVSLGMAGMLSLIVASKKYTALNALFFIYAASMVIFFSNARIRFPLLIILIPCAVTGIIRLYTYIKNRQFYQITVYAVIALLFFVVAFLPIPGAADITSPINKHVVNLAQKGRLQEAISYAEQSSAMNGHYSAYADIFLAVIHFRQGDKTKADAYLDKVPDTSFAAAEKYDVSGDILAAEKLTERAITAYKKSLEINSGQIAVRQKLISLLRKINSDEVPEQEEKLRHVLSFYKLRQ